MKPSKIHKRSRKFLKRLLQHKQCQLRLKETELRWIYTIMVNLPVVYQYSVNWWTLRLFPYLGYCESYNKCRHLFNILFLLSLNILVYQDAGSYGSFLFIYLRTIHTVFHSGCGFTPFPRWRFDPALAQCRNFCMSGDLSILNSPRKNFKDKSEWEQNKFYTGKENKRGQCVDTPVKTASKHLSGCWLTYQWVMHVVS